METPYEITLDISYNNDVEYRECLRCIFCMIPSEDSDDSIDDITRDENDYDELAARRAMDYVYENTSKHPLFMHLYEKAASHMLSLDKTIGLAVLFSYDYLQSFHKCIQSYFQQRESFDEMNVNYLRIKEEID
jgi:hypothetical protein